MTIASYSDLLGAVGRWLNKPEATQAIPDFVSLAEARFNRTIRHRQMLTHSTASISAEYAPTPPDFLGVSAFAITSTTPAVTLRYVTPTQANQLAEQRVGIAAQPDSYTIIGTNFRFSSVPDQAYTADLDYWAQIPALSVYNTNWLLSAHPDLYLYGTLLEAAPYLGDDARLQVWAEIHQARLDEINQANLRESLGDTLRPVVRFAP